MKNMWKGFLRLIHDWMDRIPMEGNQTEDLADAGNGLRGRDLDEGDPLFSGTAA